MPASFFLVTMPNQRAIKAVAVALLAFSLGLHWLVLESVAWVAMTLDFSRETAIVQVIQKTFDDRNTCSLCHAIAQGQQAEDEQADNGNLVKIEAVVYTGAASVDFPRLLELSILQATGSAHQRGNPHSPPPQV